jgi:putative restriction endonuclease
VARISKEAGWDQVTVPIILPLTLMAMPRKPCYHPVMGKGVLTTKIDPTYDDLPEVRYHFPQTYLGAVESVVGDWIVYYEPRRSSGDLSSRGGRQAYFATARVETIQRDTARSDHYYALVSNYLEFDRPVPFRESDQYYESALQRDDGETNKGAFGRAVRRLPDHEYDVVVQSGFTTMIADQALMTDHPYPGLAEEPAAFERPIVEQVIARPFRDAAFARSVKSAYDNACTITGLKIINGGGRAEVQAAHIRPVASDGPDSVRNGLALCGTVHWMFDRGLISIDDDYSILTAKGQVPDTIERLINPDGKLRLPDHAEWRPHSQFLQFHREIIFKG